MLPEALPRGPGSPRIAPAAPATPDLLPRSAGRRRSPPATPGVQRVAFGMGRQPRRPALRQRSKPQRARQLGQIVRAEPAQTDTSHPRIAAQNRAQPGSAGPSTRVDTTASTCPRAAAQGKQHRALTACPPMQIVNGEYDDLTAGLQPVEQVQQPNSNYHRVRPGLRQGPRLQPIDDSIGAVPLPRHRRPGERQRPLANRGTGKAESTCLPQPRPPHRPPADGPSRPQQAALPGCAVHSADRRNRPGYSCGTHRH